MGERTPSARDVAPGGCPDDDLLGAHLARELVGGDAERVAAHIDGCESCRELVVAFSKGVHTERNEPDGLAATEPFQPPSPLAAIDLTPPSLPGAFAGRYQLKRLIGTGGMGSVYEALDLNLHRLIALKVLRLAPEDPGELAEAAKRLVREARAMAVLSHRNVVAVYDVGQHRDQVFVAMQLVEGATLRAWLAAHARSPLQILRVLSDAGTGLAAAHAAGLVHRDFKPDNVLVSRRGTARVTDFGLARRADLAAEEVDPIGSSDERASRPKIVEVDADGHNVTRTGAVVGTPAYMAPEQAQGQPCDARADQFSFCVTAWEALFGQRPFAGTTWSEIYANVVTGSVRPTPPDCGPRSVHRALRRGLSPNPALRYESMAELLEVFEVEIKRPIRRRRAAVVALIALGAAAASVVIYNRGQSVLSDDERSATAPTTGLRAAIDPLPAPPRAVVAADASPSPVETEAAVDAAVAVAPVVAVPPLHKPRRSGDRPPVTGGIEATSTATGSATPPADPPADARLTALATARAGLDARRRSRGLAPGDLPAAYADAVRAADAALAAGAADAADAALARARAAIDGVVIDYVFVNKKLNRLNERIKNLPDDQRDDYAALLKQLSSSVSAGDYVAANRTLGEISRRLGFDP